MAKLNTTEVFGSFGPDQDSLSRLVSQSQL
jgi:hypothetical protein